VIRISGPQASDAAERIAGPLPPHRAASLRQLRNSQSGEAIDQALVLRFAAPTSSTGEDIVEFQCHGGRAVVDAVLGSLAQIEGLRLAEPGEFTRRAFENGRIDLTEAEGLADLIEAETQSQRKAALALAEGGLRKQISQWQEQLLALSAQAERAIDHDEHDEPIDPAIAEGCAGLAGDLRNWLDRPRAEPLKAGVMVVVAGPTNAGKSSLVNAIAGEDRAIVTAVPGTTRDHIEVALSLGGVPIRLIDTAGLRDTSDEVEAIGVDRAAKLVELSDVLLWLGDPSRAPDHPRLLRVHSKADLPDRSRAPEGSQSVSTVTGSGLSDLVREIERSARSVLPHEDSIALNRRQAACVRDAAEALSSGVNARDLVVLAEELRSARSAFDRLTGRAGVEDVLDALFGRFCLGK
jgi:tRNA modification GTPase